METNELEYNDFLALKWKKIPKPLSKEKGKALLTGMIGASGMPVYANTLSTGLSSRRVKEALFWEWGVYDIKSAIHIIDWLKTEGSRELYRKYYPFIGDSITPQECRQKAIRTYSSESCREFIIHPFTYSVYSLYHSMEKMKQHPDFAFTKYNLPSDIIAWDMSRLILLVRLCFDYGYLNEEEAWEHIMDADERIWKRYGSMKQFFMGCLAGCAFCHYGEQGKFEECLSLIERWYALYASELVIVEL